MAQNDEPLIRVTLEDVEKVVLPTATPAAAAVAQAPAPGARSYGNINAAEPAAPVTPEERGTFLLQGWFYLGAAGLLGAVGGWGICEPAFVDGEGSRWGNDWLMPLVLMLMLTGFAVSESIVERSWRKAVTRLALVIPLGLIFGWVFEAVANIIYGIGLQTIFSMGVQTARNPAWWVARAIAWMVFGVAGGLVYGMIGKSSKKGKYGVIGGVIGSGLGGLLFDPISMGVDNGTWSRGVGLALFGLATGAAMGFVESALKDRWLYVSAGPLAGKQFILYKPLTTIGSQQQCDIYLFKDSSIAPQHATIELRGTQAYFRSVTPVYVAGVPTQAKVLLSGEAIQIGRYSFRYNERHRS
ncbi:MAG: FHA domain-containing protein [Acidobacteriales bacterium]|nr:FHA domain-containing protein [Terriglobales bacterium]